MLEEKQRMAYCEWMQIRSKLCIETHTFFKYRLQNDRDQSAPKVTRKWVSGQLFQFALCLRLHIHTVGCPHTNTESSEISLFRVKCGRISSLHILLVPLWECYDCLWWTQSFKSNPFRLRQQFQTPESAQISHNTSIFAVEGCCRLKQHTLCSKPAHLHTLYNKSTTQICSVIRTKLLATYKWLVQFLKLLKIYIY